MCALWLGKMQISMKSSLHFFFLSSLHFFLLGIHVRTFEIPHVTMELHVIIILAKWLLCLYSLKSGIPYTYIIQHMTNQSFDQCTCNSNSSSYFWFPPTVCHRETQRTRADNGNSLREGLALVCYWPQQALCGNTSVSSLFMQSLPTKQCDDYHMVASGHIIRQQDVPVCTPKKK